MSRKWGRGSERITWFDSPNFSDVGVRFKPVFCGLMKVRRGITNVVVVELRVKYKIIIVLWIESEKEIRNRILRCHGSVQLGSIQTRKANVKKKHFLWFVPAISLLLCRTDRLGGDVALPSFVYIWPDIFAWNFHRNYFILREQNFGANGSFTYLAQKLRISITNNLMGILG